MSIIHKLRECTSIAEADGILNQVRAGPAVKKLVETGILLRNHPDKQQREYGLSFINSAIQEVDGQGTLTKNEAPTNQDAHGIKVNKSTNGFIKEETLADGNKNGTEGSEQSTDNVEPYPQVAEDSEDGSKDMEKMDDTENQMTEMMPGMGMPGMMPGLEPSVANEMGQGMPQMPPMNTPQMMKQMQYTLERYHRNVVLPMRSVIAQQKEAIMQLSKQIRESEAKTGSMKLDIDTVKQNAMARPHSIQETIPQMGGPTIVGDGNPRRDTLERTRSEIANMDKTLRGQSNPYQ